MSKIFWFRVSVEQEAESRSKERDWAKEEQGEKETVRASVGVEVWRIAEACTKQAPNRRHKEETYVGWRTTAHHEVRRRNTHLGVEQEGRT